VQLNREQMLFISDIEAELKAATNAEMQSALCIRPGNPPQPQVNEQRTIQSFDEISD
jgi:methionine salvage enolase-phosphatase E1